MRRVSQRWQRIMVIATFCVMFGGAMAAPTAVGATGSAVYLPPGPCAPK